jgi:type I restriction enzyme S subunit
LLTKDRFIGQLVSLTVDGWLLAPASLFDGVRLADVEVLSEGRVYPIREAIRDTACKRLPVGSILIAMYGGEGTIGKNGRLGIVACINQAICALLPTKSFDIDFAFAYIQFYRPHWMADAASTRKDPNISQDLIRSAPVVCPPVEEQRRIARHLGTHLARIDILTEKTQRSIDLLKERRAAFITAAVTGQIDLRESV